ncbi:putative threonine/serine exporter [Rhizoctonia solani]|uniref:Putative threonine/serine exporter n=1 Tax=Rhizoctonia solani TaxID=456999 RepID=A0A8H7ING0_9AGAM|nr:putative threonine/serine exporter [Rhizoctonia solani]
MSQHPLARRDTRVRFSIDRGGPETGSNLSEGADYPQDSAFPVNAPEPVHSPHTRDTSTHSRGTTWPQPGSLPPPNGDYTNSRFDGPWAGRDQNLGSLQATRPMPPGSRFTLDETDEEVINHRLASGRLFYPPQRFSVPQPLGHLNMHNMGDVHGDGGNHPEDITSRAQPLPNYPAPPQNTLRSAIRRSYSEDFSAPGVTRAGSGPSLEAGAQAPRGQHGLFSNLMQSYGFSRRISEGSVSTAIDSRYQSQAVSRAGSNESVGALLRLRRMRRRDSALSLGGETLLDDDDPRVTGVKPNRIDDEDKARETFEESMKMGKIGDPTIVLNVNTIPDRQKFILRLAKALMTYGAPSHRIESQLIAAARVLEVDASFVHLPSIIIAAFGDPASNQSETHFVKSGGGST